MIINEMRVSFPARSVNEAVARGVTATFLAQADPTIEELSDIRTAVSEAVTNCIVHAYGGKEGKVYLHIRIREKKVTLSVRDTGCGIEDVPRAMEPLYTTGGDDRSGMGFTIMDSFMDSLRVRSASGKGTTVTMRRCISPRTGRR